MPNLAGRLRRSAMYANGMNQVAWILVGFLWASVKFFASYEAGPPNDVRWSFGQVVPVVLLAGPLLAIFETFSDSTLPSS